MTDPEFPRLQFRDQLDQFEHDQAQEEYREKKKLVPRWQRREPDEDEAIDRELRDREELEIIKENDCE